MQVGKLFIDNFKKFQGIQNMTIRSWSDLHRKDKC
jgi:hypothetical protein